MALTQPFTTTIGGRKQGDQNNNWSIDRNGNANFAGAVTASNIATGGTQTFTNVSISGTLAVGGATTLSSTLAVTGTSQLTGTVTVGATDVAVINLGQYSSLSQVANTTDTVAIKNIAGGQAALRVYGSATKFLQFQNDGANSTLGTSGQGSLFLGAFNAADWQIDSGTGALRAGTGDNTRALGASDDGMTNVYSYLFTVLSTGTLLSTANAMTSYSGAQAATLLNGPVAGNPTAWLGLLINGALRRFPVW